MKKLLFRFVSILDKLFLHISKFNLLIFIKNNYFKVLSNDILINL